MEILEETTERAPASGRDERAAARDRFGWIQQIARDTELSASAVRLGTVLMSFVNRNSGEAWPTQETLAKLMGASQRNARRLCAELAGRGHIEVTPAHARHAPNRYRLVASGADETVPPDSAKSGQGRPSIGDRERTSGAPRADKCVRRERTAVSSRTSLSKPVEEPVEYISPGFETFWSVYPKRAAKEAARSAFERIVKAGEAVNEIVAGAERYAREREGQDPTFTKHPATWLNGGCWNDETPAQPQGGGESAKGWRSAGRGAFAGLNMEERA